ncbi:MAG: tRNA adenosine(34) deaminase TadA [Deltaproteobacteria bacterium]|nr:tRNA adenosine(34) deaminase TadA [Deltaproteobacteria bacterium]
MTVLKKSADEYFMKEALKEAMKAQGKAEVPVGAVIVREGRIISRAHNTRETTNDPAAHAEILVLRKAAKKLKSWRLVHADLYVTLEPCLMCVSALVQARIKRLVYGAPDPKAGACGSVWDIVRDTRLNHRVEVAGGILKEDAETMLKGFFKGLRTRR